MGNTLAAQAATTLALKLGVSHQHPELAPLALAAARESLLALGEEVAITLLLRAQRAARGHVSTEEAATLLGLPQETVASWRDTLDAWGRVLETLDLQQAVSLHLRGGSCDLSRSLGFRLRALWVPARNEYAAPLSERLPRRLTDLRRFQANRDVAANLARWGRDGMRRRALRAWARGGEVAARQALGHRSYVHGRQKYWTHSLPRGLAAAAKGAGRDPRADMRAALARHQALSMAARLAELRGAAYRQAVTVRSSWRRRSQCSTASASSACALFVRRWCRSRL